jgi:hypothetical protein
MFKDKDHTNINIDNAVVKEPIQLKKSQSTNSLDDDQKKKGKKEKKPPEPKAPIGQMYRYATRYVVDTS